MPFQNPQQLGLAVERHLADFVEKERAGVGLLEQADVVGVGAGERALLVAEELALHQVARNRRAVDAEHRPVAAGAGPVNGPGDQFLARCRFRRGPARSRWPGRSA